MEDEAPILCIAAGFNLVDRIAQQIGTTLFPVVYKACENAERDLAEAKASGKPIVLIIAGVNGHGAIKFLCDDYDVPAEKRRVRWIHSLSAGIDWYRLGELPNHVRGIPFTNGKGAYSYHLAVHVLFSILYFNRSTARLQRGRAAHQWQPFEMQEPRGCKVGIIGYGDIGRATAKVLQPLGMEVTGVKRSAPEEDVDEYGARLLSGDEARDRVICESDYLVNILPGTEDTEGLFNKERFAAMKPNSVYINIGRGSTQVETDLAEALRNNVISGASLDVFQVEPLQADSPLWDIGDDKIILTSHSACITADAVTGTIGIFVEFAKEYRKSGKLIGYQPDVSLGY